MARLPSSTGPPWLGRPTPRDVAPSRQWATAGVAACLRGRPHPHLGAGEPGPSRGALPFSAAENLFDGAIAASGGARRKKRVNQEGMSDGGSAPPH